MTESMTEDLLVWLIGAALALGAVVPFVLRRRRQERSARRAAAKAREHGLDQPATLHPVVDPTKCLGCGACTRVCPEGDVLALVGGQAATIAPARCVGHGLCERACPTQAITLVFGTAQRGVELPRVQANFETNVPGLYIVGELGGMGLIRNAFEQGRQCLDGIARARQAEGAAPDGVLDVLVVGAGPAGLSATVHAQRHGLRYRTVEREATPGGAVRQYPRRKLVMTRPLTVPGYGTLPFTEVSKEELVERWAHLVDETGVTVHTGEAVTAIARDAEAFTVTTPKGAYRARRVVLAIGRRGTPRRLGVPGEDRPHVYYALLEPESYAGRRVLVVGGGDAAVEAALQLADVPGTTVHLSYRKDRLSRIKPRNAERFARAAALGRVLPLWETNVVEIGPEHVTYEDAHGQAHALSADDVFVLIGGELPTAFLQSCGVALETKFGEPR